MQVSSPSGTCSCLKWHTDEAVEKLWLHLQFLSLCTSVCVHWVHTSARACIPAWNTHYPVLRQSTPRRWEAWPRQVFSPTRQTFTSFSVWIWCLLLSVGLLSLSSTWLPPDYSGIWHTEADECAVTCSMSSIELPRKLKTSSLHAIDNLNLCTPSERISDAKHSLCYRQVGRTRIINGYCLLEDHMQQFIGQWRWVRRC